MKPAMNKYMFNPGDRVELFQYFGGMGALKIGMLGTVLDRSVYPVVKWDNFKDGGHSAGGRSRDKDCWSAPQNRLKLIHPDIEDKTMQQDKYAQLSVTTKLVNGLREQVNAATMKLNDLETQLSEQEAKLLLLKREVFSELKAEMLS